MRWHLEWAGQGRAAGWMKTQKTIRTGCEHVGHERNLPAARQPQTHLSSCSSEAWTWRNLAQGTEMGRLTATCGTQQTCKGTGSGVFPDSTCRVHLTHTHARSLSGLHCHPRVEHHDKAPGQRGSRWLVNILVWSGSGLVGPHPCLRCHTEWLSSQEVARPYFANSAEYT